MSEAVLVSTEVNGDVVEFACPTDEVLLDSLRDRVGLTGVKEGCGTGDCGACSVTLDGQLVCSCLVLRIWSNQCRLRHIRRCGHCRNRLRCRLWNRCHCNNSTENVPATATQTCRTVA